MNSKNAEKEVLPLLKREIEVIHGLYEYVPEREVEIEEYPGGQFTEMRDEIIPHSAGYEEFWVYTCPYCRKDLGKGFDKKFLDDTLVDEIGTNLYRCKNCEGDINTKKQDITIIERQPDYKIVTPDQWFVYSLRYKHNKSYKLIAKLKKTSESNVRDLFMKAKRNVQKYFKTIEENKEKDLLEIYSDFGIKHDYENEDTLKFDGYDQHDILLLQKYKGNGKVDLLLGKADVPSNHNITPYGDVVLRYRLAKENNHIEAKELDILFVYTIKKGWSSHTLVDVQES